MARYAAASRAEKESAQLALGVRRARQLLSLASLLHPRLSRAAVPPDVVALVSSLPRRAPPPSEVSRGLAAPGGCCPHCEGPGRAVSLPPADCVECDACCFGCRVAHAGAHSHCRGCGLVFCDGFQDCQGCEHSYSTADDTVPLQNDARILLRSDDTVSDCDDCNGLCPACRPIQNNLGCFRYPEGGCSGCAKCLGSDSCDRCANAREGMCQLCERFHDEVCEFPY
jgi:hypothetical protein